MDGQNLSYSIIPKAKPKAPFWVKVLSVLTILLVAAAVGAIIFLLLSKNSLEKKMAGIEQQEKALQNSDFKTLENNLLAVSGKVKDFSVLLKRHRLSSNLFVFLKVYCHPKVRISDLDFDAELIEVSLKGETESFRTLGEQLLVLEKAKGLKDLKLSEISLTDEGKVNFTFSFLVNDSILQP